MHVFLNTYTDSLSRRIRLHSLYFFDEPFTCIT